MCTPCVHHEELMSLDVIPNSNSNLDSFRSFQTILDSITWLPGHVLFLRCRLIKYYLIYVRLTLTLAKVYPYSCLITVIFQILLPYSRPYDVTSCDTSCDCDVTYLFIVQKKRKEKEKKIPIKSENKRKRK